MAGVVISEIHGKPDGTGGLPISMCIGIQTFGASGMSCWLRLRQPARTMGVVGFGSIGQVVGAKAREMGMDVIVYDAVMPDDADVWTQARRVDLDTLLDDSDVVTLHCPKLPETIDLIDAAAFKRMKSGAILVKSARGGIVNEADCAAALKSGEIAGAALDALDIEPISETVQAVFKEVPNLILSPHIAGVTQESNRRIVEVAAANARRVLTKS